MILFESFNKSFSCGEINKKYSLLEIFTDLYVVIFSCAINCFFTCIPSEIFFESFNYMMYYLIAQFKIVTSIVLGMQD